MYDRQQKELGRLQAKVAKGSMSRREFLSRVSAMGLGAMAPGLYMQSAMAAPKQGGTLRQALTGGASSDSLDPATFLDSYMINVGMGQLRNNLTEIDENNQLVPELAESWDSSDAKTWVFNLRQGVEFHNGRSLTSKDVVASIQHHLGEDTKSAAKGIVSQITEITVQGDNQVKMVLEGANADFPYLMSDYHLGICPENDDGTIDIQSGIGTAGYKLESFDPGVRTYVVRNPNYWKSGRAHFDAIETLFVADTGARENGLMSDELDVISSPALATASRLGERPGIEVFYTNGNQHCTLPMLNNVSPFDDNNVVMALKYAIDRQEWLEKIWFGYASLGNDIPIGPANQFRATNEEIPQREYDLDKAKYYMKQSGYSSLDLKISVADTAFQNSDDACVLFSETARAAGINIEVVRKPDDGYWSNVWLVDPWCASYWGGRPTEDWMFSQVYSKNAIDTGWSETYFNNPRFEELLPQARAELDSAKRRDMYIEMQRIVHDNCSVIIPIFSAYGHASSDKVKRSANVASNWEFDGHKNVERWWFG
ncbi:MAG TPA: peptide ABC transporter substrate-binding protein [Gammaproteobacteria bacterium]|nr:peptide ABC transporter substrate-binding protein [Acidiferrobacteraceae bacterium]MDP6551103.1 ABC transporter substrate-binding protein [Arenicellales bacterium]MDP6790863.1 ABC transporter substrate-binding protein [Arenicellales bacterium]MDP6918774.1 ABC transporter substrate-binding protein [Arenicellales bacterium]HCX87618.1 peptide ABC transporter substrate-binding protein [Gammaproteobacteria bacterium]